MQEFFHIFVIKFFPIVTLLKSLAPSLRVFPGGKGASEAGLRGHFAGKAQLSRDLLLFRFKSCAYYDGERRALFPLPGKNFSGRPRPRRATII